MVIVTHAQGLKISWSGPQAVRGQGFQRGQHREAVLLPPTQRGSQKHGAPRVPPITWAANPQHRHSSSTGKSPREATRNKMLLHCHGAPTKAQPAEARGTPGDRLTCRQGLGRFL